MLIQECTYEPGFVLRAHEHTLPTASIVIAGALRERSGTHRDFALPLSVSFMGAGVPHEDEFGPEGATLFQVHFDDEATREMASLPGLLPTGWTWIHGGPIAREFLRFVQSMRLGRDTDLAPQIVIDLLTAGDRTAGRRTSPPQWLERVREEIGDHGGWPRVAELAHSAGVHRGYLAREFRRFYGCSVSEYIVRRRVQHAARDLCDAAQASTVAAVAHRRGFHDHAHMCRAFRSVSGLTPSAFRSSRGDATTTGQRRGEGSIVVARFAGGYAGAEEV